MTRTLSLLLLYIAVMARALAGAALSYIAAVTSDIKLGTGITLLAQRNALVLAKGMASLDVMSAARLSRRTGNQCHTARAAHARRREAVGGTGRTPIDSVANGSVGKRTAGICRSDRGYLYRSTVREGRSWSQQD